MGQLPIDIHTFALLLLVLIAAYVILVLLNQMRNSNRAAEAHQAELAVLNAKVSRVMAEKEYEEKQREEAWSGFRKFEIKRKVMEGGNICSFYLSPHDGRPLPPFKPGQYLTFQLNVPDKDKPVIKCYSLSDSPHHEDYYRVSIKRQDPPPKAPDAPPGVGSNHFHRNLNEGDIIDVKAPSGHFYLDTTRPHPVVLIGGGIGLTPVLSMLNQIVESGSTQETWFFYGVRNGTEHIMKEHIEKVAREHENVHLHICYSNPEPEDVEGKDYQHGERVSLDLFKRVLPSNNYDYYMCGPPPFMSAITDGLSEWGVPDKKVHYEAFGPASVKKPAAKTEEKKDAAAGPAAKVTFAKSGKTVDWDPEFESILDFAEENDVEIDNACRAGNCGTCITAIKAGDVEYVSEPGDQPEAGSCLVCVSIPKGDISIDA